MQAIHDIFAIWPDLNVMAAELGQKADTIYRWKRSGRIPEEHWPRVIEKAARRERLLTMSDLHGANRPVKRRGRPANASLARTA